jgi:hypothetical protein
MKPHPPSFISPLSRFFPPWNIKISEASKVEVQDMYQSCCVVSKYTFSRAKMKYPKRISTVTHLHI